jgi:ribosomal protein S18 acetylase RimI-like enzyme
MPDIVIRRATCDDIAALLNICRDSFPGSLLWTGPRFISKNWWKAVVKSDSAETWVCLNDGEICGFGVLVTDMAGWEKLHPDPNILVKLCAALMCPRIAFSRLVTMLRVAKKPATACPPSRISEVNIKSSTWIKYFAVSPHMRRHGLAKKILRICEERTLELQRRVVQLFVFSNNEIARRFYMEDGFVCTDHQRRGCVYTKILVN